MDKQTVVVAIKGAATAATLARYLLPSTPNAEPISAERFKVYALTTIYNGTYSIN